MELPQVNLPERPPAWLLEFSLEPYQRMWDLQRSLMHARQEDDIPDALMLLEHEPVITLGRRGKESHILATPEALKEAGISVYRVERGGDVTYHGPGQIVGYPILRLTSFGLGVADYIHLLEEVIIRTLSDLGLTGRRRDKIIGVWLGNNKVAAFGARIERGVTYHGFALNVNPIMEHYEFIIPCGITDAGVTTIQREVAQPVNVSQTRKRIRHWFSEIFQVDFEPIPQERLIAFVGDLSQSTVSSSYPNLSSPYRG